MPDSQGSRQPQRYCRNCGVEIRSGDRFCASCGASVAREPNSFDPTRGRSTEGSLGSEDVASDRFPRETTGGGSQIDPLELVERVRAAVIRNPLILLAIIVGAPVLSYTLVYILFGSWSSGAILTLGVILVAVILIAMWGAAQLIKGNVKANRDTKKIVGPPLDQLLFTPSPAECLDRAEGFMIRQGFTVTRGGSSASFTRSR